MTPLPVRRFGKDGLNIFLLGVGTTWFGRKWPPDNFSYKYPDFREISLYLDEAFLCAADQDGSLMIDTSPSYGRSEELIGRYLNNRKELLPKTFIATKWGEGFDASSQTATLNHSRRELVASVKQSLSHLGKIDLLYIHRAASEVLKDGEIIDEMTNMKKTHYAGINYTGASISNEAMVETVVKNKLIGWLDVIQMPASIFLKRPDLVNIIRGMGISIILNSPVRKGGDRQPKDIYAELLQHEEVSAILTGARNHLRETLGFFCRSK
ncbi:MAG: aldo/keto reductase [Candidatus Omnitrophota bacterium]